MDEERTLEQIEADIKSVQAQIDKINKKKAKGAVDIRNLALYEKNLNELLKEKEGLNKNKVVPATTTTTATETVTPAAPVNKPTNNNSLEKGLEKVEEKAQETANGMNSEEEKNNKTEDAKSAAENS